MAGTANDQADAAFMNTAFDPQTIKDAALRDHYYMLERRFSEIARFVERTYGLGDRKIAIGFVSSNQAGATVKNIGDGYAICISSALPQALRLLFARLLADRELLPWLPSNDGDRAGSQEIELALNPADLTDRQSMHISNGPARRQVAEILADIAVNFVFLHELGHILAGHTDLPDTEGTLPEITEFSLVEIVEREPADQARAWEYEADIVGSGLMNSQIDTLIELARSEVGLSRQIFGPPQIAVEQCLSFAIIALYSLFRYLRGANLHLKLTGNHPDPLIRAFCVRDALFQATSNRHPVNRDLLEELLSARFEEFDDALEAVGVLAGMELNEGKRFGDPLRGAA